jgi:hypothetical protein
LFSSVSSFPDSGPSPFLKYPEIRNTDCAEILTRFSSRNYLSCARRRAPTDLRGEQHPLAAPGPWGAARWVFLTVGPHLR